MRYNAEKYKREASRTAKGQYIRSCVVASTMGPGGKGNTAKL